MSVYITQIILTICGIVVISAEVEGTTQNETSGISGIHAEPVYLGQFGNKKYYEDRSTYLAWASASSYCRNLRMNLVVISSEAERDYLYTVVYAVNYWTAGVDRGTVEQLRWETYGDTNDNSIAIPIDASVQRNTAVYLNGLQRKVYTYVVTAGAYPLCQTLA